MKSKTAKLLNLKNSPQLFIESKGKKLYINFTHDWGSHTQWREVVVKYDPEIDQHTLVDLSGTL